MCYQRQIIRGNIRANAFSTEECKDMPLYVALIILSLFIVVLIYLSGWFSGTETALTHLGKADIAHMRHMGDKNIRYISELKKNMDRTLIAILIGNNIVNIILASVAALIANSLFQTVGVSIMIGLLTFLIIIFGEITPKHKAIMNSRKIAQKNAKLLYYFMRFLNPVISLFMVISRKIISLSGHKNGEPSLLVSDDDIKSLATLGEEEGVIKSIEKDIIHSVFTFGDRKIEDIMVPMKDVFYLEKNYSIQRVGHIIRQHGFTRVPVINRKKRVIGIVYSKDLIGRRAGRITSVMRTPYFVSEDDDITDIFNAMRQKRIHVAIVNDERRDHIGIVTLEDILEEIVGEIHDEYFEVKYKNGNNQVKNGIMQPVSADGESVLREDISPGEEIGRSVPEGS